MCNWFQNKSSTPIYPEHMDIRQVNWAAPYYFNGALPIGVPSDASASSAWRTLYFAIVCIIIKFAIVIDTNIEVIVVSLTTWEGHHSPRAKPEGCGELPRSLMRKQWPKLRYQFLFYHDETKLMMNKHILSFQMLQFVPKLSLVTAWLHVHILGVMWPDFFLLGNTCSKHCDVTVRFVTLNSNCTLNQNRQQNIHLHSWETDQN